MNRSNEDHLVLVDSLREVLRRSLVALRYAVEAERGEDPIRNAEQITLLAFDIGVKLAEEQARRKTWTAWRVFFFFAKLLAFGEIILKYLIGNKHQD